MWPVTEVQTLMCPTSSGLLPLHLSGAGRVTGWKEHPRRVGEESARQVETPNLDFTLSEKQTFIVFESLVVWACLLQ